MNFRIIGFLCLTLLIVSCKNDEQATTEQEQVTDNIDGLKRSISTKPGLVLKLLQNRYRIFLTRGMLGTIIFCEDHETGEYVRTYLSKAQLKK